jgi:hypothetical protein
VRQIHVCQSIRGALQHWNARDFRAAFPTMTTQEARDLLFDCATKGWLVLPFGEPCEGFSHQTGCPGHEVADRPDERNPLTRDQLFNRFGSENG